MIDDKGKPRCDGEAPSGRWCGKTAYWEIETEYNWLHYCDKCKRQRERKTSLYFKPKPGAYWRSILPAG